MNTQLRRQFDLVRDALNHVPEHMQRGLCIGMFNLLLQPGGLDVALAELDFLDDE